MVVKGLVLNLALVTLSSFQLPVCQNIIVPLTNFDRPHDWIFANRDLDGSRAAQLITDLGNLRIPPISLLARRMLRQHHSPNIAARLNPSCLFNRGCTEVVVALNRHPVNLAQGRNHVQHQKQHPTKKEDQLQHPLTVGQVPVIFDSPVLMTDSLLRLTWLNGLRTPFFYFRQAL